MMTRLFEFLKCGASLTNIDKIEEDLDNLKFWGSNDLVSSPLNCTNLSLLD